MGEVDAGARQGSERAQAAARGDLDRADIHRTGEACLSLRLEEEPSVQRVDEPKCDRRTEPGRGEVSPVERAGVLETHPEDGRPRRDMGAAIVPSPQAHGPRTDGGLRSRRGEHLVTPEQERREQERRKQEHRRPNPRAGCGAQGFACHPGRPRPRAATIFRQSTHRSRAGAPVPRNSLTFAPHRAIGQSAFNTRCATCPSMSDRERASSSSVATPSPLNSVTVSPRGQRCPARHVQRMRNCLARRRSQVPSRRPAKADLPRPAPPHRRRRAGGG